MLWVKGEEETKVSVPPLEVKKIPSEAKSGPNPPKKSIRLVARLTRFRESSFRITPLKKRRIAPQAMYTETTNICRFKDTSPSLHIKKTLIN
jgi:hypothetical protein